MFRRFLEEQLHCKFTEAHVLGAGAYPRTPWQALKSQNGFVSDFGVHSGRFGGPFGTILGLLWWPWALPWSIGDCRWRQKACSRQRQVCKAVCSTANVIPGVSPCHENIINNKVIARGPLPAIWCKLAPKRVPKGVPRQPFWGPRAIDETISAIKQVSE